MDDQMEKWYVHNLASCHCELVEGGDGECTIAAGGPGRGTE